MVSSTQAVHFSRTKKEIVAEFRCTSILEAACRAFARHGYDGTTVDTIAAEAQVAKGTVYLYYKSKADIYHAAVTHGLKRLHSDTEKALSLVSTGREKIEQFVRIRFDYMEQHHDFYRIYLTEFGDAVSRPPEVQQQLRDMFRSQTQLLQTVISQAISNGEIRPVNVETTARAIYDVTRGLVRNRLLGWIPVDESADVESVLDLLWSGLRPRGE